MTGEQQKVYDALMAYCESHHDEMVAAVVAQIGRPEEEVRAYLDNARFNLNTDPMKTAVTRAWDYMRGLGLLDDAAKQIDINDHINTSLYKEALDECLERYGDENPAFYEKMEALFARNDM